ncbi:MAG: single-stranded DNA-binding protein [Endomicrobiia bacterium]
MNLVIFSGNLAKDAKLLSTSTGKTCCVTTLAIREDLRPENKSATFIDLIIWGDRAEKLSQYLTKGKAISITGRIEIIKNTKDNNTYISPRVVVNTLEFLGQKSVSQEKNLPDTGSETQDLQKTDAIEESEVETTDDEVPF